MKKLSLGQLNNLYWIVFAIGIAIILIGLMTFDFLCLIGFFICFADVILRILLYRCPHCKEFIRDARSDFCPHCGKKLDK